MSHIKDLTGNLRRVFWNFLYQIWILAQAAEDGDVLGFDGEGGVKTAAANLTTHEGLTSGAHGISAFGATLVDDASAAAARTTLGLGTIATQAEGLYILRNGSRSFYTEGTDSSITTFVLITANKTDGVSRTSRVATQTGVQNRTLFYAAGDRLDIVTESGSAFLARFDLATSFLTSSFGIGTTSPAAKHHILTTAALVGQIIQLAASQTADALQVRNDVGTVLMDVDAAGVVQAAGYKSSDGSAGWTGSFTGGGGETVTVKNGLITNVA
jgi:hypothetical protein